VIVLSVNQDYTLDTRHQGIIEPSASYTNSKKFQIPNRYSADLDWIIDIDLNKNYYLIFSTDDENDCFSIFQKQEETNEDNNILIVPLNLQAHDVDLTFSEINVPKVVKLNETFTIDRTVTNQGKEKSTSKSWQDEIYLSSDKNIDEYNDYLLTSTEITQTLEAADRYKLSDRVTLEESYYHKINPDENWYLLFKTDIDNSQDETDEENNLTVVPIDITPSTIDLVVSNVTAPEKAEIDNGQINLSWTVNKQGEGEIDKDVSWSDEIYLSADGVLDEVNDFWLNTSQEQNLLTNSDSYTVSQSLAIPERVYNGDYEILDTDRDWYLIVKTDYQDKIAETNNNNNYLSVPIHLETVNVDLVADRIDVPDLGKFGEPLEVSWTVTNQGTDDLNFVGWKDLNLVGWEDTFFFSSDPILDMYDSDYGLSAIAQDRSLPVSENYTQTASLDIPQYLARDLKVEFDKDGQPIKKGYLIFKTDTGNDKSETNEDNNTTVVPITLQMTQPELVVDKLQIPEAVKLGDLVNFNWRVTNQEPVTAKNDGIRYQAYLSASDFGYLSEDDYNLGTITDRQRIYASSSIWGNGQWQIPDRKQDPELDVNQDWWFILKADSDDRFQEVNEYDNVISKPIELVNEIVENLY
jgi:hypothetical protein